MRATTRLRNMLKTGKTVVAPGVYDGMSARLVAQAGFTAAYASGGAIARGNGIPDLGLLSLAEIAQRLEQIVDVVDIPVIADADNGYGNALNAQRAAHAFERAGVAAFHLEDQTFPKRCGHYADKTVVSVSEMVGKLKAVRDALHDSDFVVIARTDAIAVESFEAAIDRCHAYMAAGADVAFLDAPTSEAQIADIARRLPGWKLINMFHGGKTPLLPAARLQELGFNIVIIPSDLQRAAIKAMKRTLAAITRDGSSAKVLSDLAGFDEREDLVATDEFLERGRRYAS
ncbi:MAG: isocitrate lyase/PEP mutase family protein [Alphaproteobacteria bacterium]|nr:isocitrate lyase/PEP mutase family protein [Alphaproteobacteria bacterium]